MPTRGDDSPARPGWAAVFRDGGWEAFVALVSEALSREGIKEWKLDGPLARGRAKDGSEVTIGLVDLAQLVARLPKKEWKSVVRTHIENTLASEREVRELEQKVAKLDAVKDKLKLRLFPDTRASEGDDARVTTSRPLDGTLAQLVFDLPSSVVPVRPSHVDTWGSSLGELERIALENVANAAEVGRDKLEMPGGGVLETIVSDHFFGATHALLLARHIPSPTENGALLIVPNRHTVLFHVIVDMTVVTAVNTLVALAQKYHAMGPGSISDQLFWWRPTGFTRIQSTVTRGKIELRPPAEFVRTLNALAAKKPS